MNAPRSLRLLRLVLALACLVACPGRVMPAAGFTLEWGSVNGGASSAGGNFSLSGTTGPTDLGPMSGGPYVLDEGGHMGMAALSERLTMAWLNGDLIVTWPLSAAGWELDRTGDLGVAAPVWTLVPPAQYQTNQTAVAHIIAHPGSFGIYRLRKP